MFTNDATPATTEVAALEARGRELERQGETRRAAGLYMAAVSAEIRFRDARTRPTIAGGSAEADDEFARWEDDGGSVR